MDFQQFLLNNSTNRKHFCEFLYMNDKFYLHHIHHFVVHLTDIYWFQYLLKSIKLLKYFAINFFSCAIMWRNTFERPYKMNYGWYIFIFNTEHIIVNLNNVYQLHSIEILFTRVRARTDKRIHKYFSTICWKMLKMSV